MHFLCFLWLTAAAACLAGCAGNKIVVGQGDADKEFNECLRLTSKSEFEKSIQCLEMFKARYPKSAQGEEAELKIGDAQFAKKDYLLAAESFLAFTKLHPYHPKVDYAFYRAGVSYFKESPKAIDRDQGYLDEAIDCLRAVVSRYQNSPYFELSMANLGVVFKRIARRDYYIGHFYYRTGEYLAAVPRFKEVANTFPDSGLADKSLYMMVKANLGLGMLEDAKGAYSELATKYPKSKWTKRAESKLLSRAK